MKKITPHLSAFSFGLLSAIAGAQQPMPPTDPVAMNADGAAGFMPWGSFGQLKSYAIEKIAGSEVNVWSIGMAESPGAVTNSSMERSTGESQNTFIGRSLNQTFRFKMFNPDPINVNAALWARGNKPWKRNTLFTASTSVPLMDLPGGGTGFSLDGLELHMSDMVTLPAGNITNATILQRNEYGGVENWTQLYIYDGEIYFWTKYAGLEGNVLTQVKQNDGSYKQVIFALNGKGERVTPFDVAGIVRGHLDNYFETSLYTAEGQIMRGFVSGSTRWKNTPPVVRLEVKQGAVGSTAKIEVTCAINDEYGFPMGVPNQAWLRAEGAPIGSAQSFVPNAAGAVTVTVAPGIHYLVFDHPAFNLNREQPSSSDGNNGGKGGAVATTVGG